MMIKFPNRSQTLTELIRTGFHVWKESLSQTMPFVVTLTTVNFLMSQVIRFFLNDYPNEQQKLMFDSAHFFDFWVSPFGISFIIFIVIGLISNIAMIYGIDRAMNNKILKFKEGLQMGYKKVFPFMIVTILCSLAAVGGLCLFIIPGIIVAVCTLFAPYLIIISNKGIIDSIQESVRLVSGNWWYTFSAILVLFSVFFVLFMVFTLLMVILFKVFLGNVSHYKEYLNFISHGIFMIVCYPLSFAFVLTLLQNLKIKKGENSKYQSFQA